MISLRTKWGLLYGFFFFIASLITMFSYNITSIMLDPFGVIWPNKSHRPGLLEDQQRFAKIEYLQNHAKNHNGFIIGNSRGFYVDSNYLSKLTGIHFYNLSVLADTIFSYHDKVKWLLRTQQVKHIVLLVSFDQFCMGDNRFSTLMTREHPEITGENWITYYAAFSNLPDATYKKNLVDKLHLGHRILSLFSSSIGPYRSQHGDFTEEGNFDLETGNFHRHTLKISPEGRKVVGEQFGEGEKAKDLDKVLIKYFDTPFQKGVISLFQSMLSQLRKANVTVTCVILPMPARTVRLINHERYLEWLSFLVQECGSIWDFSDSNTITTNKDNYLEWSHFLLPVGDLIFERITKTPSQELSKYPDFGHFVDTKNLAEYLVHWRASFVSQKDPLKPI